MILQTVRALSGLVALALASGAFGADDVRYRMPLGDDC